MMWYDEHDDRMAVEKTAISNFFIRTSTNLSYDVIWIDGKHLTKF